MKLFDFIKIFFGYVDEATELDIYKDYLGIQNSLNSVKQVLSMNDILFLQKETEKVQTERTRCLKLGCGSRLMESSPTSF
jgi:MoxR-like ATPase